MERKSMEIDEIEWKIKKYKNSTYKWRDICRLKRYSREREKAKGCVPVKNGDRKYIIGEKAI